jgi:CBS domain containing-hemolysin-like protein
MVAYISALSLLIVTLLAVSLQKTYYLFPVRELKRQARSGDRDARVLYRAAAYGSSLRMLLWLVIGAGLTASFILLETIAPLWLVAASIAILLWYVFAWAPNAPVSSIGARWALFVSPALSWALYYIHPVLDFFTRTIERHRPVMFHTGLFERSDLIDLIKKQQEVADSRISKAELEIVLHALSFGEKSVSYIMVPKDDVRTVKLDDIVGPILLTELNESKHSRFPVTTADGDEIVGTLYLRDLVNAAQGGGVRDVMRRNVYYVHEDQTLYQVLHAFLTTKNQLFVVINDQEQYVGVVTIEDVLEQIIGHKIEDAFDNYDDKKAVASLLRPDQPVLQPAPETVPVATDADEQGNY